MTTTLQISNYALNLITDPGPFRVTMKLEKISDGLEHVHIVLEADKPSVAPEMIFRWDHPMANTHQAWHPSIGSNRIIGPDWSPQGVCAKATAWAPVMSLFDIGGQNTLTFALSDAMNTTVLTAGVSEETALCDCRARLFLDPLPPMTHFEIVLRIDTRPIPYYRSLRDVSRWWASLPGYEPGPVPEHAKLPLYSAWYSFHQVLDPAGLEEQCRLAKEMGMESIIVDDGWQTDDNSRGYAYCGDWEVTENKLPDFAGHVKRVQEIGLKYILWFSVPFVGIHSKAYERFKGKFIDPDAKHGWHVLDPRFPEVREYLISLYESFVTRYGIDGFKLDFVDSFNGPAITGDPAETGRDYASVPEAADRLLSDVLTRLEALKPEILIEFRQAYIGPLMRKYGNMLRSGDVPNNFAGNRVHIVDVRLLADFTPTHADMFMWHPTDPVESAAMQIIHTIFSVPQVSVLLDRVPQEHAHMVRFLMGFWRENRDVLMDGELMPRSPEMLYPVICARTDEKYLAACYCANTCVSVADKLPNTLILVNGSFEDTIVLDLEQDGGKREFVVYRCTGEKVAAGTMDLTAGLHKIAIPPAGIAFLRV